MEERLVDVGFQGLELPAQPKKRLSEVASVVRQLQASVEAPTPCGPCRKGFFSVRTK
jgi:hypothetical protein